MTARRCRPSPRDRRDRKARGAEDAWNSRDPQRCRSPIPRTAGGETGPNLSRARRIVAFLTRKCNASSTTA